MVVDLEAGFAVFGSGAKWRLGVVVKDLEDGTIPFNLVPTSAVTGNLASAPWSAPAETFVYTIPAANLGTHKGHLCQVYAYLLIGTSAANHAARFVESDPFLILPQPAESRRHPPAPHGVGGGRRFTNPAHNGRALPLGRCHNDHVRWLGG